MKTKEELRFYSVWHNMKQRCLNKNNPTYKYYGGRGIKICSFWIKYKNFKADMFDVYTEKILLFGLNRKYVSLDRINNNKGYYKENCAWVSQKEQCSNRRKRELGYISKKLKKNGINKWTYKSRVDRGWDIVKAYTLPVKKKRITIK